MKEIQYSVNLSKSSKSQVRSVQTTTIITVIIIIIITIIIIISHAYTVGFGSDTPVEGEQYAH